MHTAAVQTTAIRPAAMRSAAARSTVMRSAAVPRTAGRQPVARGGRVRLTRRGRVLVVLTALVLLVVGFSAGQASSQAAGTTGQVRPHKVTVEPGESLWSFATRIAPHADPRLVVDQIERLNHLAGSQVTVGQQLLVPVAR
jgi:LysM repeat protein